MKPSANLRMTSASSMRQFGRESAADHLRLALRQSIILTDLQHAQVQARLMAALLAGSMMFATLDPAVLLLLGDGRTDLGLAAMVTSLGVRGCGALFLVLSVLVVPFLALQFGWGVRRQREITKLTCGVLAIAGVVWFFLAWRTVHLDLPAVSALVLVRSGVGALLLSLALAFSLNAERLRCVLEQPAL